MLTSLILISSLATPAPAQGQCAASKARTVAERTGEKSIVETAVAAGSFGTLAAALNAADLVGALEGEGPFTVFAPTDDAFAALPEGTVETLLKPENKATLQAILTYHVVPGALPAERVVKSPFATTLNGQRIDFRIDEGAAMVDGAKITSTDIHCSNGIIHVIDAVIMPSTSDIVSTAVEAGHFKTLAAALKAASLVEALQGEGPFTVFAPTDEAFAALPDGTVESLLEPENKEKLQAVLKYHVISGRVYADAAAKGAHVATLQGSEIATRSEGKKVFINDARVVRADIETSNGVIHVIDSVLLPK